MNKRQIALVVLLVVLPWILTALLDGGCLNGVLMGTCTFWGFWGQAKF